MVNGGPILGPPRPGPSGSPPQVVRFRPGQRGAGDGSALPRPGRDAGQGSRTGLAPGDSDPGGPGSESGPPPAEAARGPGPATRKRKFKPCRGRRGRVTVTVTQAESEWQHGHGADAPGH